MKGPAKYRHQPYRDLAISGGLAMFAAEAGTAKSAIPANAVRAWLALCGTPKFDDRLGNRLERSRGQLGRMERDRQIAMESPVRFFRYFLAIDAPLREAEPSARTAGRDRFKASADQVARNLAAGIRTPSRADPAASREE